ncbi:type 3 dihydrofolate reductase [Candidatus Hamiltonella defensa]|uniref:Dihydrofolate reductase n=1 Tax=Candidatus Williamhamiltonella defendens TaxID=138072 RepID=A0AAC9VK27_9ENTR|nr:type 3 dihydrofolate reductase [Candidatus Hamiltonella defensa]ASV34433.1 dihydrofolate reductase [Candidatus Hamiltonella defensa]AWK17390.1 dihydrofolate reductase [Candidatus Hamiltonella defensa]MBK4361445.1 type 3 dihydrofolate reductase [Candidatus Hamiltonella defensa]
MIISLIAAMAQNRVIGLNNKMPWHLPLDFAWFKKNTLHKPVIMGRKTFDSLGRALPGRMNIVMTRQGITSPGVIGVSSMEKALKTAKDAPEVMVIGGAEIYRQFLPQANRLYLTEVLKNIQGDTYFPEYEQQQWEMVFQESHSPDNSHLYSFSFQILHRVR